MGVKYEAANRSVSTDESKRDPEGSDWTPDLLTRGRLVLTDSDSRRRGVLGRRSDATTNVNGGPHEQ